MTPAATRTDIKMTERTGEEGTEFLMEPVTELGRDFFDRRCGGRICVGISLLPAGLWDFVAACDSEGVVIRDAAFVGAVA